MNEEFNKYMDEFKTLPVEEKEEVVIEQLKVLATLTNTMCEQLNIKNEMLINKEIVDVEDKVYSRDDFAEAAIVYINSIQNSLCDLTDKVTEVMEKQVGSLD